MTLLSVSEPTVEFRTEVGVPRAVDGVSFDTALRTTLGELGITSDDPTTDSYTSQVAARRVLA